MTRAEYMAHVYLSGIAATTERMLELRDEIVYQRDLVQTKDLTAERVQTSGTGNPTQETALKVMALREKLQERIDDLLEYRMEALRTMDRAKLTVPEQQVLHDRYFAVGRPPTWEEIAERRGYSEKHIYKIRRKALLKMAAVMGGEQ